ncbi:MAG: ferrous iron transport protein A [Clostridiales bacterium]|nr:ferrous iron transport protein A [Clostridiales bacterium]MCD8370545.1 ferrous iron transport protein A [Clostridiales bacterium]
MQALSKAAPGSICTIKWMFGVPEILSFLRSRQIREGSEIQVIQNCGSGMIIGKGQKRYMIAMEAAERIQV